MDCTGLLMPGFLLEAERFVMHARSPRADHHSEMTTHGKSGTLSSVTVGTIARDIQRSAREAPEAFEAKRRRAAERYWFK